MTTKADYPEMRTKSPTRFMPHVTSEPREKNKNYNAVTFIYFFANPTKIRGRGLVRRYFPRRKLYYALIIYEHTDSGYEKRGRREIIIQYAVFVETCASVL